MFTNVPTVLPSIHLQTFGAICKTVSCLVQCVWISNGILLAKRAPVPYVLPHGMVPFTAWNASHFGVPVWQAVLTYTRIIIDGIDVEFLWTLVKTEWQHVWLAYSCRTVLVNTPIIRDCYSLNIFTNENMFKIIGTFKWDSVRRYTYT